MSPSLRALFWGVVATFAAALFFAPIVPAVDFPQHVAIGGLLHRIVLPGSTERAVYALTPFSYNALFDLCVALFSFVMKPERAGRLLFALLPVMNAWAILALLDATERPRWYAFFALPASFSYAMGYGFVNYAIGVPIALVTFAWWLRGRGPAKVALGAMLCALAHPVVVACLCVSIAVVVLHDRARVRSSLLFLPSVAWVLVCRVHHARSPDTSSLASANGYDIAVWKKLFGLAENSLGDVSGWMDDALFVAVIATLAWMWFEADAPSRREPLARVAQTWMLSYLVMPTVFMSAWAMFQRMSAWWLPFALAAAPQVIRRPRLLRGIAVACAVGTACVTGFRLSRVQGADDARAVLDAVPANARLGWVIYSWGGAPAIEKPIWIHQPALVLADRPVELGRSFARDYGDFVLRERAYGARPRGPEWEPEKFAVTSAFGARYTTLFVRTPDDAPDVDPAPRLFGARKGARVLAHAGRFWLFDTTLVDRS